MGAIMSEKGVLKLVHPGRHVEIRNEPITAAEVMRRNPRHCITRPDVFKYPWIVVKPESVLVPGKVFFIVPYRTMYHLLKASGYGNQSSSQHNQSPKNLDHHHLKQTSPLKSSAGMTHKHQRQDQCFEQHFQTLHQGLNPQEQERVANLRKKSQVKSQHKVIAKREETRQKIDQGCYVDTTAEITSSYVEEHHSHRDSSNAALDKNQDGDLEDICCRQVTMLKSCLRKQDGARKSLGLGVTFVLPNKDDEKQQESFEECSAY